MNEWVSEWTHTAAAQFHAYVDVGQMCSILQRQKERERKCGLFMWTLSSIFNKCPCKTKQNIEPIHRLGIVMKKNTTSFKMNARFFKFTRNLKGNVRYVCFDASLAKLEFYVLNRIQNKSHKHIIFWNGMLEFIKGTTWFSVCPTHTHMHTHTLTIKK